MWPFVFTLVALSIGLPAALAAMRHHKIVGARTGHAYDSERELRKLDVPGDVARAVVTYLRCWMGSGTFEVKPEDSLADVYGICDEDLSDAVINVLKDLRAPIPPGVDEVAMSMQTVRDLAATVMRVIPGVNCSGVGVNLPD